MKCFVVHVIFIPNGEWQMANTANIENIIYLLYCFVFIIIIILYLYITSMNYKKTLENTFGGISTFILIGIIFFVLVISFLMSYPLLSFVKDVKLAPPKHKSSNSPFLLST